MRYPRVSIIILNWNGWRDTVECLESLYRITYPNYDVIVVDNGSKDDSIEKIKEYAEGKLKVNSKFFEYTLNNKPIKVFEISEDDAREGKFNRPLYEKFDPDRRIILLKNKDNYGFAGGNNVGIKFALSVLNSDYILLLNNDTVVDRRFLDELVKVAESDDRIGIVGSKIYYYNFNGRIDIIQFGGQRLNMFSGVGKVLYKNWIDNNINGVIESDVINGASMLISRKVFDEIGLFYEPYFLYFEETDFCVRAKRSGYKSVVCMGSRVWHKVGASTGGNITSVSFYYFIKNRFRFLKRTLNPLPLTIATIYLFLIRLWVDLVYSLNKSAQKKRMLILFLRGLHEGIEVLFKEKRLEQPEL
ncbi:glycosyltransferase family 2 protein [Thermococcus sp. MV5]|uniref:glycosyltransferase family 2 protein n=1 Tax=Thermococcus sp. MV5 TaxID=1638272 RepID=UPI00143C4739|nr:glycosyltransferase family 2 protein [Thermococcus sp. MV5]NJE26464.1 glycosyltransferase family 2 protein [Thermococcus sp. MV5]